MRRNFWHSQSRNLVKFLGDDHLLPQNGEAAVGKSERNHRQGEIFLVGDQT